MDGKMNQRDKKKLQRLIDASVKAHNAAHKAGQELDQFVQDRWGADATDDYTDHIIDGCMGGCGLSRGLSADEFISEMHDAQTV